MATSRRITIVKGGPYQVSGAVPLAVVEIETNSKGESITWSKDAELPAAESYKLCRCGKTKTMPFCDGTHSRVAFEGTQTASHKPFMEQAKVIDGPAMQLADTEVLCASARFCDPNGRIWNQVANSDDPQTRAHMIQQAADCPAGRLVAIDRSTGKAVEPTLPPSIGIIEDPSQECSGPLWVRGGIELVGEDGIAYEIRNRMTLCRCGRSENKPFCNGAHASEPKFQDGLPTAASQREEGI